MLHGGSSLQEIASCSHLASILDIPLSDLEYIAANIPSMVAEGGSNKKKRSTLKPLEPLKTVQKRIKIILLDPLPLPESVNAYRKKRSQVTAALPHLNAPYLLSIDIRSFFPSIHYRRIFKFWLTYTSSEDVAHLLTRLTTYNYHLALGLVTVVSV